MLTTWSVSTEDTTIQLWRTDGIYRARLRSLQIQTEILTDIKLCKDSRGHTCLASVTLSLCKLRALTPRFLVDKPIRVYSGPEQSHLPNDPKLKQCLMTLWYTAVAQRTGNQHRQQCWEGVSTVNDAVYDFSSQRVTSSGLFLGGWMGLFWKIHFKQKLEEVTSLRGLRRMSKHGYQVHRVWVVLRILCHST